MGLFTPKISRQQMAFVQTTLKQMYDSGNLVNTTVKPDVFFKRLNFTLDLLLRLQPYEKYKIFKHGTPSKDYKRIVSNLEATVDDFIDRAIAANQAKIASLKTERARKANYEKFVNSLIAAFDCAHTFWEGDRGFPHYDGPLFTEQNYRRVQAIYDASCEDL
ncbi:MAG: hypothetical protein MR272_08175 [Pseudoflavonifractor sp.]|nr:hypothetical protein [Pseudoflavonifractor sp.]MDY3018393.1 hypothetical protein [Oscillospiraceae bacterium]